MNRAARAAVADKMAGEIHEYLAGTLAAGIGFRDETWEAMKEPDDEMMTAVVAWERGETSYEEFEAAGTRYVEAWAQAEAAYLAATS